MKILISNNAITEYLIMLTIRMFISLERRDSHNNFEIVDNIFKRLLLRKAEDNGAMSSWTKQGGS